ncbi:hypothetical protein BGZ54_004233 [Gamsiella multidivaricata]|nr:hypothetical protein BGZ54_004233 [Gamsiella multidivaricata]
MSAPSIAPAAQYTQHASATIDAHAPGGSTPAPTPKLTVAPNGFRINSFNIHRLLITCLMVAAKFTSDLFYSNARYAKVGGLSLLELNQLELEFLFTTRFELNVKVEELQKVGNALLRFKNHEMIPEQPAQSLQNKHQAPLHGPQMRTPIIVAANGHHSNVTTTATSEVTGHGGQSQQAKAGRFSIPSPTSPRNGPMSDRAVLSATLCSSSASSTTTTSALVSTAIASSDSVGNAHGATAVVASEASLQRPQLLSPPEEKHTWAETEVQMTEERIDQAQDQKEASGSASSSTDSALSSDPSSSSSPS